MQRTLVRRLGEQQGRRSVGRVPLEQPPGPGSQAVPDPVVRIVLVGKPGCHLCEAARDVVARVAEDVGFGWEERSILDDRQLHDRFWEQIPVVLVDGRQHDFWRVDEARLRAALTR